MSGEESALIALAAAVADGSAIDWEQAESDATSTEERFAIARLREIAALRKAARDLQPATWGSLEIRREVGRGSFGSVYLAHDPRLGRDVALKLLHNTPLGQAPGARTIAEGRLLAQIRHPNVITVYGADEHDNRVGVWMEFVHGRTLKEIIEERGRLGADEAALIGRDVCRALAAVHKAGFLHRDIKAQNVMREDGGRTVLMDFGAGYSTATAARPPSLIGTPVYLAPELIAGGTPSAASDLYSVGVLLYFLVSGLFPVTGASLQEITERHANGQRVPLADIRPDLPPAFLSIVDAAIAVNPSKRPQSAGAMASLLEGTLSLKSLMPPSADSGITPPHRSARKTSPTRTWLAGVTLAAVVAIGVAFSILRPFNTSPAVVLARNSVAILPFESLPSDAANDYLGEGITQDLASHLGTIRDLRIVAGASTIRFKNAGKSPKDIGSETGVAAVLVGTVQRNANRLNVFVQLIDASSGEQIWSERFERDAASVFSMQSEISRKIAIALRGELSDRETERLRQGNGRSFDAFDLYLKGRHAVSLRTADGLRQAVTFFQEAIGRDATFAGAHAGLAEAYVGLGAYGVLPRSEAYARSMDAARHALDLDPSLPEAYAALGYAYKNRFEWDAAETNFKHAIELRPGYATAHHWYSIYLTQLGRFPEAIAEIQAAISLDPFSVGANQQFAGLLLMARRYQDAISQWQRASQMDPAIVLPYRGIAEAYAHMSLFDKARDAINEAMARAPQSAEDQELKADRGFVLALSGRKTEARRIARELEERHRRTGEELGGSIAAIYSGLGDTDAAFDWLQKALDTRDPELGYLKVDPRWDGLRGDSRLDAIMAALHLTKLSK